ncbi:NAD-dependent epimerase/dehydratase family protein [Psychroflexus salinarum]|uniref:NAD-dependent epimerase/dehydratase family protein n=1 Tax=Psychroflexus salinarum TaxID=546024 RepID=A0ABW3GWF5_9FLAO
MNILITGLAGFIGSHMAEYLVNKDFKVDGIDNFNPYYSKKLKRINAKNLTKYGIKVFEGDLNDNKTYEELSLNYQFIIHFAAQPGISASSSFESYLQNNFIATQRLIEFAKQQKQLVQFINISTSSVYGEFATKSETALPQPTSHYGVTKLAAEQLVLAEARKNEFKACSLRLYSVYGPRERPDKLYTKLIKSGLKNEKFPLFEGSKAHKRSFTYVDDIVKGIYLCLKSYKKTNLEIINIGHNQQETTENGILYVEELLKKHISLEIKPPREADQKETVADISKAKDLLGYSPKTDLKEGLKQQIEWYKEITEKYGEL